jgi:hypothetical protein
VTDVFLYQGEGNPTDVKLRDPTVAASGGTVSVVDAGAIASAEAFGQPSVSARFAVIGAGAIPSAEAFGQPTITFRASVLDAGGIGSAEAFGEPSISARVPQPAVVPSGGLGGRPILRRGEKPTLVLPGWRIARGAGGIESEEAFGEPRIVSRRDVRRRRDEEAELLAA